MIHLEVLAGLPKNKKISVEKFFSKKWKFWRKILHFSYCHGNFRAGELTMEWLLFFLRNKEDFMIEYLQEFNKKFPILSEMEMKIFLDILFADFNKEKQKTPENIEQNAEKMHADVLLSIGMAVRHIRLSYGDIMVMRVADFYELMKNIEFILWTKPLEERTTNYDGSSEFVDSKALMELKNMNF